MSQPTIWEDIGYAATATPLDDGEHVVEVRVVSIYAETSDGVVEYEKINDDGVMSLGTADFDEANTFLSGSIKWDGCSNLKFDEQETVMLHFCSRKGLVDVGVMLGRVFDLASALMPKTAEFRR